MIVILQIKAHRTIPELRNITDEITNLLFLNLFIGSVAEWKIATIILVLILWKGD